MNPSFKKGLNTYFFIYLKFSQTSVMAFQPGTEKSLDGIANYFIRFGLCLKISQIKFMAPLSGIEKKNEFKYQYSNQRENY